MRDLPEGAAGAELGPFDEHLGLGASSPWIAAEESDYLARAVGMGARIRYEPDIVVEHPGPSGVLTRRMRRAARRTVAHSDT